MSDAAHAWLDALHAQPRLGWAAAEPVVESVPALAHAAGWQTLLIARDDRTQPLYGGSKVRKLDYLLAAEPFASAPWWTTVGAIGSGHLVACTAAAQLLGRSLRAHIFWEPLSPGVQDSLAYTVSHAAERHFHRGRVALALRVPAVLARSRSAGAVVIPPGGTHPIAMLGLVRAGLQFALQVAQGRVARPDVVYVSLGSGGTAVGLAAGLALGGLHLPVRAVLAVEPVFATRGRVRALQRALARQLELVGGGLPVAPACPMETDAAQVGPGYGWPTPGALAATERATACGFPAEPVYTGKVLAALLAPTPDPLTRRSQTVLFWDTVRRTEPPPHRPDWQDRLPQWLIRRLAPAQARPRRWFLGAAAALGTVAAAATVRGALVQTIELWHGRVLSASDATTLHAACEALLPPMPPPATGRWPWLPVVQAIDRYLWHLPRPMRSEVSLLCTCVAQCPLVRGLAVSFADLTVADRLTVIAWMAAQAGPLRDAHAGLVGLVMLGAYQLPTAWAAIGYEGPMVAELPRPPRESWDRLHAVSGTLPAGLLPS